MSRGPCEHQSDVREVTPSGNGCENCMRTGGSWISLRLCMTCGHVGCCDSSPNRHATAHWHENPNHRLIRSFEHGENWWWCFEDQIGFDVPGAGPAPSHQPR